MEPKPLWQHYLDLIQPMGVTAEPWSRDRPRVEALFAELYRLGERPSKAEVSEYLDSQFGPSTSLHRKTLLSLWAKRLQHPHRRWRSREGYSWSYPFVFADKYVREHELTSVSARLARQVALAARAYAEAVDREPGSDESEEAADEFRAAAYALDLWGKVSDRNGEDWLGDGPIPPRRTPAERRNPFTRRGRRHLDEWHEEIRRELE